MVTASFGDGENVLELKSDDYTLKNMELYILKGLVLWYVGKKVLSLLPLLAINTQVMGHKEVPIVSLSSVTHCASYQPLTKLKRHIHTFKYISWK